MNSIILIKLDNINFINNLRKLLSASQQVQEQKTDVAIFLLKNQKIDLINISKIKNINNIFICTQNQEDFLNPFLIAKEYISFLEKYDYIISCNNDFGSILLATISSLLDYEVITNIYKITDKRFFHVLLYNSSIQDVYTTSNSKIFLLINTTYFDLIEYQENSCEIQNIYYSVDTSAYQVIKNEINKRIIPYNTNLIIGGDELSTIEHLKDINKIAEQFNCFIAFTKKAIQKNKPDHNLEIINDMNIKLCIHIGSNESHKELSKIRKAKVIIALIPNKYTYLYEIADFVIFYNPKDIFQLINTK